MKQAESQQFAKNISASMEKAKLEKNESLDASSLGNDVIILRDPSKPSKEGQNLAGFYMKNAEGKFQAATKEAFHEYIKMMRDKGEKLPEEKPMDKKAVHKDLEGKVFNITSRDGKSSVTLDFESNRELSSDERIMRELRTGPTNVAEPMTTVPHLADKVDRTQQTVKEFNAMLNSPAKPSSLMQQLKTIEQQQGQQPVQQPMQQAAQSQVSSATLNSAVANRIKGAVR